jgi:uncharacterized protein YutE (UPF0331/DUF86 family)
MNERIKELLDQATIDALFETQNAVDLLDNPVTKQQRELQLEKFAELIVQECLDISQDRAAFDGFPPNDVNHIIDEIREHFGVEE